MSFFIGRIELEGSILTKNYMTSIINIRYIEEEIVFSIHWRKEKVGEC